MGAEPAGDKIELRTKPDELQRINPGVRVVLLTGCQDTVVEPLFKKGLKGYLPKPFNLPELAQKVRDALTAPALGTSGRQYPPDPLVLLKSRANLEVDSEGTGSRGLSASA
jgi:DNA-binding NtrC family response regulator